MSKGQEWVLAGKQQVPLVVLPAWHALYVTATQILLFITSQVKQMYKLSRITRDLHIPRVRLHIYMEIMKSLWQYCFSSGQTLLPTSTCRVGGTAHWPEADADGSQQSPHPAELVQGGHAADPSSPGGYLRLAAGVTLGHTKWDLCRDAGPLTSSPCQALLWECLT